MRYIFEAVLAPDGEYIGAKFPDLGISTQE